MIDLISVLDNQEDEAEFEHERQAWAEKHPDGEFDGTQAVGAMALIARLVDDAFPPQRESDIPLTPSTPVDVKQTKAARSVSSTYLSICACRSSLDCLLVAR